MEMTQFYYINSAGERVGPLPLSDASVHRVTANTMVWMQDMPAWARAAEVPALAPYISSFGHQPPVYGAPNQMNRPSNYLWLGILTTLLCCLPLGIVSIVYAAQVDGLWSQGKYEEACRISNKAKNWGLAGVIGGFIISVLYVLYITVLVSAGL